MRFVYVRYMVLDMGVFTNVRVPSQSRWPRNPSGVPRENSCEW